MERYFILDKFNTWYDWHLIITAKDIPDAEPKTNYINLDGMSGSLDLSEALTGEITYSDRTISATLWTDYGTRKDREALLQKIVSSLHGKKIKIIEPDDPDRYLYGRVIIKSKVNTLAYAELTFEAICDPWRYSLNEITRTITVNSSKLTNMVIRNNGVKTLNPVFTVTGSVNLDTPDIYAPLTEGTYKLSGVKLRQGVNIIGVSGNGSLTITYQEADL